MAKPSNKAATQTDLLVGQNIRVHRVANGLTQGQLGSQLGLTFQQVQKYETGKNRVNAGRLYQIAELLGVPVKAFFKGEKTSPTARHPSPLDLLDDPAAMAMLLEFSRINDRGTQRSILNLVEQLAVGRKR